MEVSKTGCWIFYILRVLVLGKISCNGGTADKTVLYLHDLYHVNIAAPISRHTECSKPMHKPMVKE